MATWQGQTRLRTRSGTPQLGQVTCAVGVGCPGITTIPTRNEGVQPGERAANKENPMTEHGAQYDHIGSKYDEYARTATLKRAESYTFFRMVGTLAGQHVLDLACGFGFYTRLLKQRGAAQVVGVDISPEMIRLAQQQEQAEPLGITYQVGDAVALPQLGRFDLVTAVYLLNYAESKDQMLALCRSAYNNLVTGGRFIVYTVNPA